MAQHTGCSSRGPGFCSHSTYTMAHILSIIPILEELVPPSEVYGMHKVSTIQASQNTYRKQNNHIFKRGKIWVFKKKKKSHFETGLSNSNRQWGISTYVFKKKKKKLLVNDTRFRTSWNVLQIALYSPKKQNIQFKRKSI